MNLTFTTILDILGFVQGTLLGIILLLSFKKNKAIPFLGLFLVTYSIELILSIGDETGYIEQYPELLFLPLEFYWLFMPALFIYTKNIAAEIDWRSDYKHFLPGIVEFIVFSILFLAPVESKIKWDEAGFIWVFHFLISFFLVLIYTLMTIRLINRHKKRMADFYSSLQGKTLRWIKWICYYILFTLFIIPSFGFFEEFTDLIFSWVNVIFIFWVALSGFRQVFISLPDNLSKQPGASLAIPPSSSSDIHSERKNYDQILNFLQTERPFTDPKLNLASLAEQLHFSPRRLSNLINEVGGINFNQLINRFRVENAKELLSNPDMRHLNLLGIAYEVGFNSKTSFYTTFKQMTGQTPAQFKKSVMAI